MPRSSASSSVPDAPRTRRQEQALARRAQILDASLQLFAAHGFAATTTKQIAQTIGVTEGLIFRYFPDKVSLLTTLAHQQHTFVGQVFALLDDADGRPVREVLREIALGWLTLKGREADLTAMLFTEGLTNPELGHILHEMITEGITRLARFLEARVQREIRPTLPFQASAALFFSALVLAFIQERTAGKAVPHPEDVVAQLLDAWCGGAVIIEEVP